MLVLAAGKEEVSAGARTIFATWRAATRWDV